MEDFETFWKANRERLLAENKEYQQAKNHYKMSSGADWLLFAIPAIVGILSFDHILLESEVLKWLCCAAITIVSFVVCVWIKSMTIGGRSPEEIEREIKEKRMKNEEK